MKHPTPRGPDTLQQAVGESPEGRTMTSNLQPPNGPSKAAPVAIRLDMDVAVEPTDEPTSEPTAESPRKRHYDQDEDLQGLKDLEPSCKRGRISPKPAPKDDPEPLQLPPTLQSEKRKVCRAVSFESKDQEMPDKEPESGKAPCDPDDQNAKLEFEEDCAINDEEFAFLHCDETQGEPLTQPEPVVNTEPVKTNGGGLYCLAEIMDNPEPVVKTEGGCSRLIDSAKKFANEEKTPLKSSNLFNTSALLRSASQSLAGILSTPPTTNKAPVDKKTPSSKGKGMCYRMSQADVFGEDSSSDSDDEDK